MTLTLSSYIHKVQTKELSPHEVIKHYLVAIQEKNPQLNAFVSIHQDYINNNISILANKPLCSAPIALKDNILTKGHLATSCSNILTGYQAPYSATCFSKLEAQGACVLGKTNMDEFAMGTTSEFSCHGGSKNPHDITRIAGGSSGGSAVAVAADLCLGALGTDTGGSVRFPAAMCGVVGMKQTYGRISRYGIMAMASSFDQVGTLTKTVQDASILLKAMAGQDNFDATSVLRDDAHTRQEAFSKDIKSIKIALPTQCFGQGCDPRIIQQVKKTVEKLQQQGAHVEEVDMPLLPYAIAAYYTLVPAEVMSNLARYDGMRFGAQGDTGQYKSFHDYMDAIRTEYIGPEVKRRILIGSYVLSSEHYEGYFLKAQKVRMMIKQSFDEMFKTYDLIITPTTAELARKIGERVDDPLKMYLADIYTVPVNLAGLPAISVPCGTINEDGTDLPLGIQLIANQRREDTLFQVGNAIEQMQL